MQTLISSKSSKTSSFVKQIPLRLLILTAFLRAIASNQPHLLARPVVVPNSFPFFDNNSPILQVNSVGNGPDPTRVVYALTIPMTSSKYHGPRPVPVIELPAVVFEEVT